MLGCSACSLSLLGGCHKLTRGPPPAPWPLSKLMLAEGGGPSPRHFDVRTCVFVSYDTSNDRMARRQCAAAAAEAHAAAVEFCCTCWILLLHAALCHRSKPLKVK